MPQTYTGWYNIANSSGASGLSAITDAAYAGDPAGTDVDSTYWNDRAYDQISKILIELGPDPGGGSTGNFTINNDASGNESSSLLFGTNGALSGPDPSVGWNSSLISFVFSHPILISGNGNIGSSSARIGTLYAASLNASSGGTLAGNPAFTGNPTFSGTPQFSNNSAAFTVSSTAKIANLHADFLDNASVDDTGTGTTHLWTANKIISYVASNSSSYAGWALSTNSTSHTIASSDTVDVVDDPGITTSISDSGTTTTLTISHSDTSSQASVTASGDASIRSVSVDTFGHVTGLTSYNPFTSVPAFNPASGSVPFSTNASGLVTNLNADKVDNKNVDDTGSGDSVLWTADKITTQVNTKDNYNYWTASTNGTSHNISSADTLDFADGNGIDTSISDFGANTTLTISHADTSSVSNVSNDNATFVNDITFDTYGHVQSVTSYNPFANTPSFSNSSAPFTVTSTSKVTNLNADFLAGRSVNDSGSGYDDLWTAAKITTHVSGQIANKDNYNYWTARVNTTDHNISTTDIVDFDDGSGIDISINDSSNVTTVSVSHTDTSSQASVTASGDASIRSVSVDTFGHVTGLTSYNPFTSVPAFNPASGSVPFTTNVDGVVTNLNADKVDGKNVDDTGSGTSVLWTADKITTQVNTKDNYNRWTASTNGTSHNISSNDILDFVDGSGIDTSISDFNNITTLTISHADTSSVSDVANNSSTFVNDITFDTYGHVQSVTSYNPFSNTPSFSNSSAPFTVTSTAKVANLNADFVDSASVDDSGTGTTHLWTANKIITYVGSTAGSKWTTTGYDIYRASRVAIGKSSAPGARLDIEHSGSDAALRVYNTQATNPYGLLVDNQNANLTDSNYIADFRVGGFSILKLNNSGEMTFAPNSYGGATAGNLTVKKGSINSHSIRLEVGGTTSSWLESRGYLGHSWYVDTTRKATLDSTGLGLGVTSPSRLLHLSSAAGTFARFTSENSDDFSIGANSNGFVVYNETDSAYPFVVTNTGRVGINETSPQVDFHINNATTNGVARISTTHTSSYAQLQLVNQSGNYWYQTIVHGDNSYRIYNGNDRLTILSDGKFGLGCSNPNHLFTIRTASNHRFFIRDSSTSAGSEIQLQAGNDADNALTNLKFSAARFLFENGHVGLVTPPSNQWGTAFAVFNLGPQANINSVRASSEYNHMSFSLNAEYDDANNDRWEYITTGGYAANYYMYQGAHIWRVNNTAGAAGNEITWNNALTLSNSGNLTLQNTSTDANPYIQIKNDARQYNLQVAGVRSDNFEIYDNGAGAIRLAVSSAGRVGINTTDTKNAMLYVEQDSTSTAGGIQIGRSDGSHAWAISNVGSNLRFGSDNTSNGAIDVDALTLTYNGNVGVGVTPSAWRSTEIALQVDRRAALYADSHVTTALANNLFINNSGYALIEADAASQYYQYQGAHVWQTVGSGSAGANVSPSTNMRLHANGDLEVDTDTLYIDASLDRVGVNTSSLGGNFVVRASQDQIHIEKLENFAGQSVQETYVFNGNPAMSFRNSIGFQKIQLSTYEVSFINTGLNFGVGLNNPLAPLSVASKASSYEGMELVTPAGDGSGVFQFGVHQSGSSAGRTIQFRRGGTDGFDTLSTEIGAGGGLKVFGQNLTHGANSISIGQEGSGLAQFRAYGPDGNTRGQYEFMHSASDGNHLVRGMTLKNGQLGLGTDNPGAKLSIEHSPGTAYANAAPNISVFPATFINTANHASGGVFTGLSFNLTGNSKNRINYVGAVTESADQKSALVFGTESYGTRSEKLRITSGGAMNLYSGSDSSFNIYANNPGILLYEGTTYRSKVQWNSNGAGNGFLHLSNAETTDDVFLGYQGYTFAIDSNKDAKLILRGSNGPYIRFQEQTTDKAYIQWNPVGYLDIHNNESGKGIHVGTSSSFALKLNGYLDMNTQWIYQNSGYGIYQSGGQYFYSATDAWIARSAHSEASGMKFQKNGGALVGWVYTNGSTIGFLSTSDYGWNTKTEVGTAGRSWFRGAIKVNSTSGYPAYSVDVTGSIRATSDVVSDSDIRHKSNIEDIENAIDIVTGMRGVWYEKDDKKSVGVIAQEIEEVLPEVVHTAPDKEGTKSVSYGNIVGVLIEAIKEQQAEIDALKARLN